MWRIPGRTGQVNSMRAGREGVRGAGMASGLKVELDRRSGEYDSPAVAMTLCWRRLENCDQWRTWKDPQLWVVVDHKP